MNIEEGTKWTNGVPDSTAFGRYGNAPSADWLEILYEADWAGDWEFDQIIVWKDTRSGELRAAVDSGCSCPSPFGDLTWDGMRPISAVDDLKPLLYDAGVLYGVPDWDGKDPQIAELKARVHRALRDGSVS